MAVHDFVGMKVTTKVEGLRSLEDGLFELEGITAKRVVIRSMRMAMTPMMRMAKSLAPVSGVEARAKTEDDKGYIKLKDSIKISTRVHKRHKAAKENDVELYMGPGGGAKSIVTEFGSFKQNPTPYMRPAWDALHEKMLDIFVVKMRMNIKRALARHEAKMRRLLDKK